MPTYALIGFPLTHSFSQRYFTEKFSQLGLSESHRYLNFSMPTLDGFLARVQEYPDLRGCNVTIPHKQAIIPYLDTIDPLAKKIGAVNTILFADGTTRGFNTDIVGFRDDLLDQLVLNGRESRIEGARALILGTGGASLAVRQALHLLEVETLLVSRKPAPGRITYADLTDDLLQEYTLIVNTTPLGTFPNTDEAPNIPYELLSPAHFCYDLVYNPLETTFMRRSREAGAAAANGLGMLHRQAEASWQIWNDK